MAAKIVTPGETNALRISAAINNHAGLLDAAGAGPTGIALDSLSDVNAPSPTDGQALVWDAGNSEWIADDVAAGGGGVIIADGIEFPATQVDSADPNTLDDYEEGSWTPTLIGATVAGTHTYAVQIGRYTKIGNMVVVWARISLSALDGAASGFARVTGLPFTAANVTSFPYPGIVGAVSLVNLTAGYSMFAGQIGVNSDFIAVQQLGDNIANLNINVTDFQNTSIISFQFCYRV